jgi:hypothetical protein
MDRDLYDVLGVPRTAPEEQIRHAYWSLAKKYHPDVSHDDPDAGRKFIEAQNAAETLLDPARRASYDASLRAVTPAAARSATTTPAPAPAQPTPPASPQGAAPPASPPPEGWPTSPPPASSQLAEVIRNLVLALVGVGAIAGLALGLGHPKNSSGVIPDNGTVVWEGAGYSLDNGWGINLAGKGTPRIELVPGTTADIMVAGGYLSADGHIALLPPDDAITYQHCVSAVEQSSKSIPLVEIGPIIHGTLCLSGGGGDLASIQVTHDDGANLTFNIIVWEYV